MKKIIKHTLFIAFIFLSFLSYSQNNRVLGYKIINDEVVFTFDKRDYKKITNNSSEEKLDFNNLTIDNIVVSGEFNDWSLKKWTMHKIDENIFELRKHISDFTDEFTWQFKFVINNKYWAEPSDDYLNSTSAKKNGYHLNVSNLKMYTTQPNENGNAFFKIKGYLNAKKVVLSGTFNKWDEDAFLMTKNSDGWKLALKLNPGEYEYKFIVDGEWIEDVKNPLQKRNRHGSLNSILHIKKFVTFKLNGFRNSEKVVLSGSFNNWSENEFRMTKTKTGWEYTIELSGKKHHYKFIVDNEWMLDPDNSVKEYDNNGHINSVRIVK